MRKKIKERSGELIFGIHPIVELLKAKQRKVYTVYTTRPEPKAYHKIKTFFPKKPIQIQYVTREKLNKMTGTTDHQGIVALVQSFPFRTRFFEAKKQPFIILLDGVHDVGNLGAIIRSAYCTNCDGLVMCKKGGAPLSAAAIKASAGLAEHLPIYEAPSVQNAVAQIKQAGYKMYLAALGGKDAREIDFSAPLCIVIGKEATGITKSILNEGEKVYLAQRTADISYNASVAAGILLYMVASSLHKI